MNKVKIVISGIIFLVVAVLVISVYVLLPKNFITDEDKKNAKDLSKKLKNTKSRIDKWLGAHPAAKRV